MAKKLCNVLIEIGIISLIIFPPLAFGAIQFRHITYIHAIIFGIGIVWVLKAFVKSSITYIPAPIDLPILLFLVFGIVNLLTSTYAHNTERELYLALNYGLLYFLIVQHLKTVRRIIGLAFIIILVGSGESLFGLFQYLQGAKTVLGFPTPNIGTVNATYFSHNHFAGFLILIIPIALSLLIGAANLEKKLFLFLLTGLMGVAFVLTLSRGGFFSFFIASGFFFICFLVKRLSSSYERLSLRILSKYLLLLLLLLLLLVTAIQWIGISPIAHRSLSRTFFPTEETLKQEIRFPLWRNAFALVKEFPAFGSGLGTFEYVFLRYRPAELPQDRQAFHAHNDYLELLIEMGFPGLLIVLWAILRFFSYALKGYFQHRDPVLTSLVLGGLTSCTAMLIHSFFDFNLQIPANALLFFIVLALTTATVQLMNRGKSEGQNSRKQGARRRVFSYGASRIYHFKPSWVFIIGVIGVLGLLAFNFRENIATAYYSRAKVSQYQDQPFEAITLYKKAMAIDGGNALFHESLGELFRHLGKTTPHGEKWYKLAIQEYQNTIALNAYDPVYYYYLGWTYDALYMEKEAVQAFETAITYNPRISFYYENLGKYFLSIDQIEAAMRRFKKAVQINPRRMSEILSVCNEYNLSYHDYQKLVPDDAESHKIFASLLAQQRNWEASKIEYRKAIELSGKQTEYYNAMLQACRQQNDYECMRTLWQELWQQKSDNLNLPIQIAESFAQQQLWDQAIEQYQAILTDNQDNIKIHQRLAELYQQQGRHDEAIEEYTQILDLQPDAINTYHHIAGIYRQNNQWKAAIEIYNQALENGLVRADVYSSLGELYFRIGDKQNAFEMYKQAVQAGETRITIYQELERMYQAQQNKIDAELLWDTYTITNKHSPEALFQLVMHYHNNGEWLKAVTLSKEVIAIAPTDANYRRFLANLYEQKGMLFETIQQWEKLVNMHSENIEYHLYLAMLYEQAEQWDKAKVQYRRILRIQPNNQQAQQRLSSIGG
jgi:tetratricopeptide (TPR) repeat protein/O-antigen ligase